VTAKHEVIVIGGGVVGAALTLALARAGIDVALVERGEGPKPYDPSGYDLRVYALSPATADFLDRLGVWTQIASRRISPYERMRVWHHGPDRALSFDAAESRVPELGWIVENDLILEALWRALKDVTVYRNAAVESYSADENGARIRLQGGRELTAKLVAAADGADSRLRELAGIETVSWDYPQRAIVCHVVTERPHRRTAWQRFLPSGPLAFLPLADGRSSIVWSTHEASELLKLPEPEFRTRLADAIQQELGDIREMTQRAAFPLRLLHAREYVQGPLVLLGDAAHVIHPLAGQGVNLGLADAAQLAAVLGEFGAARPSPRALARYERRRKAENLEMLALTDALNRAFGLRAPLLGDALQLGMQALGGLTPLKTLLARRALGLA
jgi:ubiquinone biosynthesis UbiH/UbiF/VisC/COQ6 family hydroxylase